MLTFLITTALVATPNVKPATNTVCPVGGDKVNAKSQKVVVRGHEYYICCPDCAGPLTKNPEKFLEKDGTPKNAKK
ncbi:MAG: hypothetical protein H6Q00_1582 [Holophagaceae bacterium]|nr:hypothetical protein [Holophagaceae bacterium]